MEINVPETEADWLEQGEDRIAHCMSGCEDFAEILQGKPVLELSLLGHELAAAHRNRHLLIKDEALHG